MWKVVSFPILFFFSLNTKKFNRTNVVSNHRPITDHTIWIFLYVPIYKKNNLQHVKLFNLNLMTKRHLNLNGKNFKYHSSTWNLIYDIISTVSSHLSQFFIYFELLSISSMDHQQLYTHYTCPSVNWFECEFYYSRCYCYLRNI